MRHAVQLLARGRVELGVAMPMNVAPQAANPVEIIVAVDIRKRTAPRPLYNQRFVFSHLREGVPNVAAVPVFELLARGGGVFRFLRIWRYCHE